MPKQHTHAINPSNTRLAIAYRVNRKPVQRARLLGLVQMAGTLGALNTTDRTTLADNLECIGGAQ